MSCATQVLPPAFFALITYPIVGLHPGCASCLGWFLATLVGANVAAASLCMAIGAASPSNSVANLTGSLTMMLLMLFGGFLLNRDSMPFYCRWMSSISFFSFAYEVGVTGVGGVSFIALRMRWLLPEGEGVQGEVVSAET